MLLDLKNIEKSSPKGTTRKPEPRRLRLLQPPKLLSCACPRSATAEVSTEESPKKDDLLSTASGASL